MIGLLIEIFLINFICASFTLAPGNKSYDIAINYSSSEPIKGWINISFQNENANSILTAFDSNITFIDFLKENYLDCEYGLGCSCSPSDCGDKYVSSNGQATKTFSLGYNEEKIISFLVEGNISSISKVEFNVSVTNSPGCLNPLKIDILNDGIIEWKSKKYNSDFVCTYKNGMGCFNPVETLYPAVIDNSKPYCEKIGLVEGGKFILGSWVKKGSTAWHIGLLKMFLYDLDGTILKSCNLPEPTTSGGEISCPVEYNNDKIQEYYVCIQADSDISGYETKRESVGSCGFYALPGEETEYHDYYIFAKAAKFDYVGKFIFNQDEYEKQDNTGELAGYILDDYILDRYKGNCANGCSIPVRFKSYNNIGLNIEISDVKIKYSAGSGPGESNLVYDTSIENAKINSNFLKLDLLKANLLVPPSYGSQTFSLKLGSNTIIEKTIKVLALPKITNLIPTKVPALVSYPFTLFLEKETSNLTYTWDFGDNSTKQVTISNIAKHAYTDTGDYDITVTVSNKFGNSSKTFSVEVISPKNSILDILTEDKQKIIVLKNQINKLPEWVMVEVERILDIDGMESDIKSYEEQYERAFNEDSYVNLMKTISEFKVPSNLTISQRIPKAALFLSKEQLNLDILESLGAGNIDTEEDYNSVINTWLDKSLEASIESETYALNYDGSREDLISHIKVTLIPNENLGEVYFIVNGDPNEIIFSDESNTKKIGEKAKVIIFNELAETKTIEFLYPGKISVESFPIYIAPEFKNLNFGITPGICNFNNICEKNLEENYKNCRNDCKPYLIMFLFLTGLILAFLIVYIALQEWYKRHYESKLFPDKNQLFNLINFIANSLNQGLKKSDIFSKLKDLDWSDEQLNYAWNKFNGKRTGMWEIPVFKWVENRQVKRELEKRQNIPIQRSGEITGRALRKSRQPNQNSREFRYR